MPKLTNRSELIVVNSVSEAARLYLGRPSLHPLIHVFDLAELQVSEELAQHRICTHLYGLVIKHNAAGQLGYGRQHYDFNSGVLTAFGPGQTIEFQQAHQPGQLTGWALYFHPDLLLRHPLARCIKQFGYFSYNINEALHLSETEQVRLAQLVGDIEREIRQNLDDFSLDILLTSIELLLTLSDRYYHRQLLTRKAFLQDDVERFIGLLDQHIQQASQTETGLPSVLQLAETMHMSPNYLSDLLRHHTGKSAQELIHQHLIEQAKYLLLNSNDSAATIAYQLGFDYPQYFSRLFKQKVQMTPGEFRRRQ